MKWTLADDRILKANCGKGYRPLLQLLPGRSRRSISGRASRKGWIVCPNYTPAKRAHMAALARATIAATSGKGKAANWIFQHSSYPKDDCLIWPFGHIDGCGFFGYRGHTYSAAAFMCELAHGPKPTPRHRAGRACGEKRCINPGHLKWMTQSEVRAAHERAGKRFGKKKGAPRCTLNEENVAKIWTMKGTATQRAVGAIFGVSYHTVGDIWLNKTWVGGKKAFGGFRPGDPNNPSTRRRLGLMLRPKSGGMATNEDCRHHVTFAEGLVPRGILDRDYVVWEIVEALCFGASPGAVRWQDFQRKVLRENHEPRGIALDAVAFGLTDDTEGAGFRKRNGVWVATA